MKKIFCVLMIICFVALAAAAAVAGEASASSRERCPVCNMYVDMFAKWNATVEFKDADAPAVFCGAKCLFKYYLDLKKYNSAKSRDSIGKILVKDYASRTEVDALSAHYVIWSDVYGPMGHEPIPFAKKAAAQKFQKEHKGKKIVRFQDVSLKLIHALDNP
ncbi:MAG: nitrous oxide reductase accessory protein NosL [Deltaproteobacteria bacterium]|nr:nitrous oxide reductase accessory protein NosL [Deltaproteobacteria bacterium]